MTFTFIFVFHSVFVFSQQRKSFPVLPSYPCSPHVSSSFLTSHLHPQ